MAETEFTILILGGNTLNNNSVCGIQAYMREHWYVVVPVVRQLWISPVLNKEQLERDIPLQPPFTIDIFVNVFFLLTYSQAGRKAIETSDSRFIFSGL